MNKGLYLLVLILLMLHSCRLSETKDASSKQSVDLFVRYLQPEQEYKAEAILLEGDSLPLAKSVRFPEGIRFFDKELNEVQVSENLLRYSAEFRSVYQAQAKFSFRDKYNTIQSIPLSMEALSGIDLKIPSNLEGQVELTVARGGVLKQGESLVLVLTDRNGQASTVTVEGPSTNNSYRFPFISFGNPVRGEAEVYLVKKQVRDEQKGKLLVHLTEEVYSESFLVKVP